MAAATILHDLVEKYRQFVIQHADILGRCESAARILAYFTPGGSEVVSELVSSLVGVVVLINDAILRSAANIKLNLPVSESYLMTCLTVLDNMEVFLEMASYGYRGEKCRWALVACVHFIKAVIHLVLLYKYKRGIISSCPIPSLKRDRSFLKRLQIEQTSDDVDEDKEDVKLLLATGRVSGIKASHMNETLKEKERHVMQNSGTFVLKSSGRTVRTLTSSANHIDKNENKDSEQVLDDPTLLTSCQVFAETLHILRPLVHLFSVYMFGQNSWRPFMLAGGVDVTSLLLMGSTKGMNGDERDEMKRRSVMLLLYLMRSPFYDKYSRKRIMMLLGFLVYKIPALRVVIRPLVDYLPVWQRIYFYVWMN